MHLVHPFLHLRTGRRGANKTYTVKTLLEEWDTGIVIGGSIASMRIAPLKGMELGQARCGPSCWLFSVMSASYMVVVVVVPLLPVCGGACGLPLCASLSSCTRVKGFTALMSA
jgi:hypothetical protein